MTRRPMVCLEPLDLDHVGKRGDPELHAGDDIDALVAALLGNRGILVAHRLEKVAQVRTRWTSPCPVSGSSSRRTPCGAPAGASAAGWRYAHNRGITRSSPKGPD